MSVGYAMEDEEDVLNEPVMMDDLSDQVTSDVLEPAKKVRWEIRKASIRKQHEDFQDKKSPVTVTRLALQVKVGEDGTDGQGKYAGRVLFPEFILSFAHDEWQSKGGAKDGVRNSEWWEKSARGPAKELFLALGFDLKAMPAIDTDFLSGLEAREFIADLTQSKVQEKTDQKNEKGKFIYKDTGDYQNELKNFKPVE